MAATVEGESESSPLCNNNKFSNADRDSEKSLSDYSKTSTSEEICDTFGGYNIDELYNLATTFLKEKEGKAFQITYEDKLLFVAYSRQVSHGHFVEEKAAPLGYLDVIGRDRRKTWQKLGSMSQNDAKTNFINLLHNVCPLFRPFVLAHKCDLEEKERKRKEEEDQRRIIEEEEKVKQEEEKLRFEEEEKLKEEKERQKQNYHKRLIQEALNRQTFHQFKAYAEKQYPGDPEQQAVLIRQLQEQHYQQYMQQVLQEQLSAPTIENNQNNHKTEPVSNMTEVENPQDGSQESSNDADEEDITAANMWTRKDITDFKEAIRKEGGDGIIKVGHGETVTVRVPTHDDGTCLFWEFATDNFDLGFGVYFEWTRTPDAQVTVHISESEDEEEEEEELDQGRHDIEKGVMLSDRPPLSVIIPIYRRDCHEEVYAGSHVYPGQGVYLLKFDNSYSLWRSKTLYYRVYYTR